MPNNYLSVLYKHIIQVENKNLGLNVGGTNIPLPPFLRQWCVCEHVGKENYTNFYVTFTDESRSFFSVQTDGSLTVKRRLDRDGESGLTSFNVTVIAEDEYGHSTSRVIFVTIDDVNDNAPSCTRYLHIVSVEENTTNGK